MEELEKAKLDIATLTERIKKLEKTRKEEERLVDSAESESSNRQVPTVALSNGTKKSTYEGSARTHSTPQPSSHAVTATTPITTPFTTPYSTPLETPSQINQRKAIDANLHNRTPCVNDRQEIVSNNLHSNQIQPIIDAQISNNYDQLSIYRQQLHYMHSQLMHPNYMLALPHQYQSTLAPTVNLFGQNGHFSGNSLLFGYQGNNYTNTSKDSNNLSVENRKANDNDMEINLSDGSKVENEGSNSLLNPIIDNYQPRQTEPTLEKVNQKLFQPFNTNSPIGTTYKDHLTSSLSNTTVNNQVRINPTNQIPPITNPTNQIPPITNPTNQIPPIANPTHHQSTPNLPPLPNVGLLNKNPPLNNNLPPPQNEKQSTLVTGGTTEQDSKIMKFSATIIFKSDLNRTKWESKSEIMSQITKNFRLTNKKLAGPISVFLKNNREIVIKGERESDFLLFENSKNTWVSSAFDKVPIQKCEIERTFEDNPSNMLIGYTYDRMSPEGIKWLKKESKINKVRHRGGNRYDIRFLDGASRDDAKNKGYVQGGGVILKVGDWVKQLNTYQCDKCAKWGHKLNECGNKKQTCKYCAALDEHISSECPYLNVVEEHKCSNCKNKLGHNATERLECLTFLDFYQKQCIREGVEPEKKYLEAKTRVEKREYEEIEDKKGKFEEQVKLINQKLADQLRLNKEMLTNEEIDVGDYTQHCEKFIDPEVLKEYKKTNKRKNK
jgi:hypothetical protein